jgi:hypothetical protein
MKMGGASGQAPLPVLAKSHWAILVFSVINPLFDVGANE